MTMHVVYSHECPGCKAYYIPYDADVPCPRCGAVEEERFDYVPQAAASMRFNRENYGSYTPGAWWVGSLGDHVLRLLFGLFDAYEGQPERPFAQYLDQRLAAMEWGDQAYLRDHLRGIALRVAEELGVT
jgi:hypothetical protein